MNKSIVIDNIEYELVPKIKCKTGDWVWFIQEKAPAQLRKIIGDNMYPSKGLDLVDLDEIFGLDNWMTEGALAENKNRILRKASETEVHNHLKDLAIKRGFVLDAFVDSGDVSGAYQQKIIQTYSNYFENGDELAISGIIVYKNGQWAKVKQKPKLTFGGYECSFKKVLMGDKYNSTTIEVTCKGETGTHHQIAQILTHYFRPLPFGKVLVKNYSFKEALYAATYNSSKKVIKFSSFDANLDKTIVDEITIGCLTGTYKELKDIFEECSRLLKETK